MSWIRALYALSTPTGLPKFDRSVHNGGGRRDLWPTTTARDSPSLCPRRGSPSCGPKAQSALVRLKVNQSAPTKKWATLPRQASVPGGTRRPSGMPISLFLRRLSPINLRCHWSPGIRERALEIPDRIYNDFPAHAIAMLAPSSRVAAGCTYTRHHDGNSRQQALHLALPTTSDGARPSSFSSSSSTSSRSARTSIDSSCTRQRHTPAPSADSGTSPSPIQTSWRSLEIERPATGRRTTEPTAHPRTATRRSARSDASKVGRYDVGRDRWGLSVAACR